MEYHEALRPQFHFTAAKNWLNDPNGLVYYRGVYHLFFQYTPGSLKWGPNCWGHAVSSDLLHWKELTPALAPDDYGWIWSGSAVVDWNNTSGLGQNNEPPLVALYTTGNGKENLCVQSLAFSTDAGATWRKYASNPVLPHVMAQNRDPKVIWDDVRRQWVMALYLDAHEFALFGSPDLLHWHELSRLTLPGDGECPDFFWLPLDGKPNCRKWIFTGASKCYQVGTFDGIRFIPETEPMIWDTGRDCYAAQTWSDLPDHRRVQIAWMNGGRYPGMPFNQQMNLPCELTLKNTPEGIRLCRQPIAEIAGLQESPQQLHDVAVPVGRNGLEPWSRLPCDLLDLTLTIEPETATAFDVIIGDEPLRYLVNEEMLVGHGTAMKLPRHNGTVKLRIIRDKTSWEIFGNDGETSMSSCLLPHPEAAGLTLRPLYGSIRLVNAARYALNSIWP